MKVAIITTGIALTLSELSVLKEKSVIDQLDIYVLQNSRQLSLHNPLSEIELNNSFKESIKNLNVKLSMTYVFPYVMSQYNRLDLRAAFAGIIEQGYGLVIHHIKCKVPLIKNGVTHIKALSYDQIEKEKRECLIQHLSTQSKWKKEYQYILDYKSSFNTPYPVAFNTADCVLKGFAENADGKPCIEILLIKRKHFPYKGSYALPGGFVDEFESVKCAALRELKEETGIELPLAVFNKAKTVSNPFRSLRGRVVSHVLYSQIFSKEEWETIKQQAKAQDDAESLYFIDSSQENLSNLSLMEDHFDIIFAN